MDPNGGGAGTSTCVQSSMENMTPAPTVDKVLECLRDNCYKTHGRDSDGPADPRWRWWYTTYLTTVLVTVVDPAVQAD